MLRRIAFAVAALTLASPASADDAIATALSNIFVECPGTPDTTSILVALQRAHRIGKRVWPASNSENCWRAKPALTIDKMQFQFICASNVGLAQLLPDLYWSGPGTQPLIGMRLLTSTPLADVMNWAAGERDFAGAGERIGPDNGNYMPLAKHNLVQIECEEPS